ncbi:acyltransferase [Amycolatopsis mediterranei S699]|uniref:Acyltransferase n=3 Tax=Amycolatopsis mediterranei TaxID=33910 RepID=A0A0H3DK27_AMYMU|nr:acyltransferase [Amycolatopsis mediterranei U32]AEK47051.1 acyltransferase [Amycolatopsis mediterranei S699]AGT88892.1 acyltransferase [Amycolatopsis mediterranei RB]KDO07697.1 acyltransferase [Amycolatopsis mediterranei]AFO81763.1 acyltransferase [Amycolatopsis mediterranei S699]
MRTMSHEDYLGMRRFPGLDGLRALAATMVIFFHFGGPNWTWLSGWVGVYLFFVLSGFLITTLLLREQDRTGRISLSNFYIRRVFRILPPYLVILGGIVAFVVLRGEFYSRDFPQALKYYLTFLNEFLPAATHGADNFFSGSWTLGIEEKFYLVWPFLLVAIGIGAAKRKFLLVGVAMVALLALVPLTTGGWVLEYSQTAIYRSTIHYFILAGGCLLAILLHYRRGYALLKPLTHPLAAIPIVVAFALLHTNFDDLWHETRNNLWLLVAYAALTMLLLIVLVSPGPLRWLLSTAPMRFVGERSYSLYLLQGPVHFVVVQAVPGLGAHRTVSGLTVFLVGLAIADLIHRWVEKPLIDVGKQLIARKEARRAERQEADHPAETRAEPAPVAS